jgi:hypothetical protein
MLIQEEIIRIRELMSINEATRGGLGDDLSKKFAQTLAKTFKKLMGNLTDEDLLKLVKKNQEDIKMVFSKIRNSAEESINQLPINDLIKLVDSVDLKALGELRSSLDSKIFQEAWAKRANEFRNMSDSERVAEFTEWSEFWYKRIVENGFGKFEGGVPLEFKPFYESYFDQIQKNFRNIIDNQNPGFRKSTQPVNDFQDYIISRTWDNIIPISQKQIKRLVQNKEGFQSSFKALQQSIKDFFSTSLEQVEELMSLIKQMGESEPRDLKVIKERISFLTQSIQKRESSFFEQLNRWVDENILREPNLKSELQKLDGYQKAKKLSDDTTLKEINEKYKTYSERAKDLRGQYRSIFFKWGKSFKKKYESDVGKFDTIFSSPKFKELRNSYLFGSTLSPKQWLEISRELGLPSTIVKMGKEYALTYLYWTAVRTLLETIWEYMVSGLLKFETFQESNFLLRQVYDEEGKPEFVEPESSEDIDYTEALMVNIWNNFLENLTDWNTIIPGLIDETVLAVVRGSGAWSTGNFKERVELHRQEVDNARNTARQELERLRQGSTQSDSTTTTTNRLLIPNDLESLFPQDLKNNLKKVFFENRLVVGKFKYVISDESETYEYAIQKKEFEKEDGTITTKWAIELPMGSDDWFPLDDEQTMANIIAASK